MDVGERLRMCWMVVLSIRGTLGRRPRAMAVGEEKSIVVLSWVLGGRPAEEREGG